VCTVWLCGSMSYVWCVYCVLVLQRLIFIVCVLFGVLAAFNNYSVYMFGGVAPCHICSCFTV